MYDVRDWWLNIAKTLWVGDMVRVAHLSDKVARPSVIIRNDVDKYSAWCHRRNTGDVVFKTHVIPATAPTDSARDDTPTDLIPLASAGLEVRTAVESFLIGKGVPSMLIPPDVLHYSDSRKRLVFKLTTDCILGRDLTETSLCKWVDYTAHKTPYVGMGRGGTLLLVEDCLSMFKVAWAVPDITTACLFGTKLSPTHQLKAMDSDRVVLMLDGDAAGVAGTRRLLREVRALGVKQVHALEVPTGLDPKDLRIDTIRRLINGLSAN